MTYTFEPQFFEEEVVSLLSDEAVSSEPKLRMVTLEELLRSKIGPLAVYYDRGGLRGDGAARLDVRYIPVHIQTGVFHPKIVLLLTEADKVTSSKIPPALICGVLSSNLTRGGWWSHLEGAHFEVAEEGAKCSWRDDLLEMLLKVRALGSNDANHEALDKIQDFMTKSIERTEHATLNGRLRTRLCAGTGALASFLYNTAGDLLRGKTLEVISPFFDEHTAAPLWKLMTELGITRCFVYLPRDPDGAATCSVEVYEDVLGRKGAHWAELRGQDELLRLGKDKHAKARSVHAKVYRFTSDTDNSEALLVGSHNLTTPATARGGNFEASFFVEVDPKTRVEPWLRREERRPKAFDKCDPALESSLAQQVVIPLQVSFNWAKPEACRVLWEGLTASPELRLSLSGAEVFSCVALPPGEWQLQSAEKTAAIQAKLVSSSLLTVHRGVEVATILVQEEGMARKPSILLTLSPTEILAYWARLTVAQRVEYLQERLGGIEPASIAGQGLKVQRDKRGSSMFDTYAGIFHGFEMLQEQVSNSLQGGYPKQAEYLLFGERHDSLPRLLHRVLVNEEGLDTISRYLMILSARQLLTQLKRTQGEFAKTHAADVKELIALSKNIRSLRAELSVGTDHATFLDWFEGHFLRRRRDVPIHND